MFPMIDVLVIDVLVIDVLVIDVLMPDVLMPDTRSRIANPTEPAAPMSSNRSNLARELRPMLRLALPLAAAEIGWMSMGIVDTIMVGHLPNAAIPLSAVALAQVLYNTLAFGIGGVLLGLDTVIAQSHGAGKLHEANRWLFHGALLAVALAAVLIVAFALAPLALVRLHLDPEVLHGALVTLYALNFGTLPLLLYFTLRRYLQAFNHVRFIAGALISANLINLLFNWLLIYGHRFHLSVGALHLDLGWSALGVEGSGLATSLARVYQFLVLVSAVLYVNRRHAYGLLHTSLRPQLALLKRLVTLGAPAGATILVEISIFAIVTFLISTLGPVPLAGHEIALNCISTTFMIPLGISAAASVRVGQAIGRRDLPGARASGWAAIVIGAAFMLTASALFLAIPQTIAAAFTHDRPVIAAAVPLFFIAAIFQFCDGLQITAIGALRGAGDTHSGLITHLCSYWLLGLPFGIFLCFHQKMGARGLWLGLCASLIVSGATLLLLWHRKTHTLALLPHTSET